MESDEVRRLFIVVWVLIVLGPAESLIAPADVDDPLKFAEGINRQIGYNAIPGRC